eukprot:PITA_17589
MKVLSFNCRGIASPEKKLALRLLQKEPIDLVFLQETLGVVDIISPLMESMLPGWHFQAIDVNGRSGGIALGYNPRSINLMGTWGGIGFIGADIYPTEMGTEIRMINIYGPYHHRENLWERILAANIFQSDNIILGGDLNFSLGYSKSWGHHAQADPLAGELSYHLPIYLDIWGNISKPRAPVKFNSTWLKDNSYMRLVTNFWKAHPPARKGNITEGFVANLKELKKLSKIWAHNKQCAKEHLLNEIKLEIANLQDNSGGTFPSNELTDKLTELTVKRGNILKEREETWRLQSTAIWLKEGDDNSKFFHKFANGRKVINTIWKLTNEQGAEVDTFPHLPSLATSHFKQVYQAPLLLP